MVLDPCRGSRVRAWSHVPLLQALLMLTGMLTPRTASSPATGLGGLQLHRAGLHVVDPRGSWGLPARGGGSGNADSRWLRQQGSRGEVMPMSAPPSPLLAGWSRGKQKLWQP